MQARRVGLLISFLAAYLLSYFFRSTNAVLADDLQRDAGLGTEELGVMTSLFFAVFAAAQLPLGAALDRFGPRFVPALLMLFAAAGSLITALADGFAGLALGRGLIGLGMAGVLMGALKAFSAWFAPRRFATLSSTFVGVGSVGALGATVPLAAMADGIGWRGVFFGAAAVTAAIAALLMIVVRAAPPRSRKAAEGGVSGGGEAVGAGVASISPAASTRSSAATPTGFAAIFRSGPFWRLALLVFALNGGLFAHQGLWAGPFMTTGLGYAPAEAARALLWLGVAATLGFLVAGPLADRFGTGRMLILGGLLATGTLAMLASLPPLTAPLVTTGVWMLYGIGAGMTVLSYAHSRALFPAAAGRAVTAINLFAIGGSALLQAGLGVVVGGVSVALGHPATDAPLAAYRAALWTTSALVAVGIVAWFAPHVGRSRRRSSGGTTPG